MPNSSRVLIVDSQPIAQEGLAIAIRHALPGRLVEFAGSIKAVEAKSASNQRYDLIIIDLMLPDVHGFSGFLEVQGRYPTVPIAVISCLMNDRLPYIARELGAADYLTKTMPLDMLADRISRMARGETMFPEIHGTRPPILAPLRARLGSLSPAQRRVLFGLADGCLNKQIAGSLGICEATVKAHLTSIYRKLDVLNRAQALLLLQPMLTVMPRPEVDWDQP